MVILIAALIAVSGCTGGTGSTSSAGESSIQTTPSGDAPSGMPARPDGGNMTGMRTPPDGEDGMAPPDGNMTRPGMPGMEMEEPTEDELAEVASVFGSGNTASITEYCTENNMLCMYYCMQAGRDDTSCQDMMESLRPEMVN